MLHPLPLPIRHAAYPQHSCILPPHELHPLPHTCLCVRGGHEPEVEHAPEVAAAPEEGHLVLPMLQPPHLLHPPVVLHMQPSQPIPPVLLLRLFQRLQRAGRLLGLLLLIKNITGT